MAFNMKRLLPVLPLILLLSSCSLFGTNPSAPTATEGKFFNIVTNYVTEVITHTNVVNLTNNVVQFQTNQVGQLVLVTNQVLVSTAQVVLVTNVVPAYTMTPNSTTTGAASTIGAAANLIVPGGGGLVTLGITLLAGLYGYLRSYKNGQTGNALSQEMETVLEFIKALPNGATYATALTNFMAAHQSDAGVVSQVGNILANDISNPDAKVAAQQVIDAINALQVAAAPGAPSAPAAATTATAAAPVLKVASVPLTTPAKVG
jgi:hypothetical protein